MTRRERDEIMRYVGQVEGLLSVMTPAEGEYEEDSAFIFDRFKEIANDLECLARGLDKFDIPKVSTLAISNPSREGGDGDDV